MLLKIPCKSSRKQKQNFVEVYDIRNNREIEHFLNQNAELQTKLSEIDNSKPTIDIFYA